MFDKKQHTIASERLNPLVYIMSSFTMAILTILLIWIGVNPSGMMDLIRGVI
jgi:NADH-quinone oxidoreductase subunit N